MAKIKSHLAALSLTRRGGKLAYETVYRIASLHLSDGLTPYAISKQLSIPYSTVNDVISAKTNNDAWIDAIADLGRKKKLLEQQTDIKLSCGPCALWGDECPHMVEG